MVEWGTFGKRESVGDNASGVPGAFTLLRRVE